MTIQTNQILYDTKGGLQFRLTPLTLIGQQHFRDIALKQYPDVDPAPFEQDDPHGFLPDQKTDPNLNPEYRRLVTETFAKRDAAYREAVLNACVGCEHRDALLAQYGATINDGLNTWLAMPKEWGTNVQYEITQPWVALLYMTLCSVAEIAEMLLLIQGKTPVTEGEIIEGFKYFRRFSVQRNDSGGTVTESHPSPLAAD